MKWYIRNKLTGFYWADDDFITNRDDAEWWEDVDDAHQTARIIEKSYENLYSIDNILHALEVVSHESK